MRGSIIAVILGAALALGPAAAKAAETLTFKADFWCPYNCTPGKKPEGYLLDILRAVYEPKGYTVTYELMPYQDAIEAARKGEITGVLGAARKDAPDLLLTRDSEGYTTYAFATAKGSGFKYAGPDSLKGKRFGAIQDYTYDDRIDAYIAANKGTPAITLVSGDTATKDLITQLAERKLDVIIEGDAVLEYSINLIGMGNLFDLSVASEGAPVYVALSPKHPKAQELLAMLETGVEELRKSGKLAEILKAYGLKDWKK
ncbi:amino acid ABC transporter substrate-binding protein [Aerophototrophica crusticola]|uniref:Amino acid ABC transporter substrate-binding protein n=1 Tax=Aerophototrophica crusticola TaxID=1709002 RepID=A0A858R3D0_9PROT|nr:amino acid ABC transporter substrate-binding protein [Rhodospirillaceae bacterium B3]